MPAKIRIDKRKRYLAAQLLLYSGPGWNYTYQMLFRIQSQAHLKGGLTPKELEMMEQLQKDIDSVMRRLRMLGDRLNRSCG